jgi:two-component system KDP operon response regulator KdpE
MKAVHQILIVEDHTQLRGLLSFLLSSAGYETRETADAVSARAETTRQQPDLVLLDWQLPDMDGIKLLRLWRADEATAGIPVIMVSGKGEEVDRVTGLKAGADDYVTKPFGVGELLARIKVALRHAARPQGGGAVLRFDRAVVDLEKRTATRDGEPLHLTPIEFRLLAALARHRGMVVIHRQLLVEVWGPSHAGDTHYLRIYVKQLRDKLELDPLRPHHLVTEIGVGYRLECGD